MTMDSEEKKQGRRRGNFFLELFWQDPKSLEAGKTELIQSPEARRSGAGLQRLEIFYFKKIAHF